jgi:predicted metal-binding membrane protein
MVAAPRRLSGGGVMPMGEMSMWTRMPGQTWPGFAASFLAMWMTMMVPMMIAPLAVMLWRFSRGALRVAPIRLGAAIVIAGLGYVAVWSGIGLLIVGVLRASRSRRSRLPAPNGAPPAGLGMAWRQGLWLGIHCVETCAPLMVIAFAVGGTTIHLLAGLASALRTLSLTFDRKRHILLSNVMESAQCTPMPTSCKARSTCSS